MGLSASYPNGVAPQAYFSLTRLGEYLKVRLAIPFTNWAVQEDFRARRIRRYRDYYDGNHKSFLTPGMRGMLRIVDEDDELTDNYIPLIVDAEADRLSLNAVEGDSEAATAWAADVMDNSRVDSLQPNLFTSVLMDGDTYLMSTWDNEESCVVFKHELAFDGRSGMVAVYESNDDKKLLAACKIWHISSQQSGSGIAVRVNIYLPDQVIKLISADGCDLQPYSTATEQSSEDWTTGIIGLPGDPIGVPVVHFRNRGRYNYGTSEIVNCIKLQNALNRVFYSMLMNSELNAFGVRWAKGFQPPNDIAPGSWITMGANGLTTTDVADVGVLPASDGQQYLNQSDWLIEQMHRISQTPNPEFMGGDPTASGEALKQREAGLIGKVKRAQVGLGEGWEQAMKLAVSVQAAFGSTNPPVCKRWRAVWQDAELRNDQVLIQNVLAVEDHLSEAAFLREAAPAFDWDETTIEQIIEEKAQEAQEKFQQMAAAMPTFSNQPGMNGDNNSGLQPGDPNVLPTPPQKAALPQ